MGFINANRIILLPLGNLFPTVPVFMLRYNEWCFLQIRPEGRDMSFVSAPIISPSKQITISTNK